MEQISKIINKLRLLIYNQYAQLRNSVRLLFEGHFPLLFIVDSNVFLLGPKAREGAEYFQLLAKCQAKLL